MSIGARLTRLERQAATTTATDSPEWQAAVRTWVAAAARGEPAGPIPPPPPGVPADRWPDALWARACWSARLARRIGPTDHLPGLSPFAQLLVGHLARDAAGQYAAMVRVPGYEAEPWPGFLPDPPPGLELDDELDRLNARTSFAESLQDVAPEDLDVLLRLGSAALGRLRIPAAGEVAPDGCVYYSLQHLRRPWWAPTRTPITLARPDEW